MTKLVALEGAKIAEAWENASKASEYYNGQVVDFQTSKKKKELDKKYDDDRNTWYSENISIILDYLKSRGFKEDGIEKDIFAYAAVVNAKYKLKSGKQVRCHFMLRNKGMPSR